MDITGRLVHRATPDEVFAMLVDPEYVRARAEAAGAVDIDATVREVDGHMEVTSDRTVPAELPAFARHVVGEHLRISETHRWDTVTDDVRNGTFEATFAGTPVVMRGRIQMVADDGGTVTTLEGTITAPIPLVGRKVEAMVHDQVMSALAVEQDLGDRWLAGGR